jgi:1-aminocyclopropane-1-carboxylate deaminase/D-cysteine desulfhydrase-like pyridoxal-dependent ACC family enzyme
MNPLASRFPDLDEGLPLVSLTQLPTRLCSATNLGARLNLNNVLIKRDDLSAELYGGNKVRKLEYLIGDAVDKGCDSVVTFGAVGSNHALATAIYARQQGLRCYAIMTDQPMTPYVASTLRYHTHLGTILIHADGYYESVRAAEKIETSHPAGADNVYRITWGGSSWRGVAAFVNAALELSAQFDDADLPERIYVACGTMGTAVGLAMGLRVVNWPTRVVAVQVVPEPVTSIANFENLFDSTNRELHDRDRRFPIFENPLGNVDLRTEFLGDGYALPTQECEDAVKLMGHTEGLELETTYTGKALAALIHDARAGVLASGPVVFWDTYNGRPYPADLCPALPDEVPEPFRPYLTDA